MTIHFLNHQHLAELAAIDAAANRSPWSLHSYQQAFNNPNYHFLGIFNQQEHLIGGIVYSIVSNESEILQICIAYPHQRQGYAHQLFNQVFEDLRSALVDQVFLEVMVGNEPAINLYHKLGFNVINKRKQYYLVAGKYIDALVMAKQL